jgi:hypothetical protein
MRQRNTHFINRGKSEICPEVIELWYSNLSLLMNSVRFSKLICVLVTQSQDISDTIILVIHLMGQSLLVITTKILVLSSNVGRIS